MRRVSSLAYNEQVLAYQTLKSTQSQTQEKSDERAKQLLGSRVVEQVSESERENGNGREISSGSRQTSNEQRTGYSGNSSQEYRQISKSGERLTNKTSENALIEPTRPIKNKNGSKVAPTPTNTPKTQNNANSNLLSSEQYRQTMEFLREFNDRLEQIAQNILENQLKALRTKAKPILATFEKLRDNEPLFFGKDKWRQDKQQALNAYNAVKEQHDKMKANGITDEHRKQANEQLAKDDPSYHERGKQAFLSIKLNELAELDNLAKQHGADKHARAGQTYRGKIIQSDDKMSLQETTDGIVFHRIGELEVGKGYTLSLSADKKSYSIQQDYEIRTRTPQQEHDQDKGKGR
ncbi:TPA: hypothetical protein SIC49_002255 [Pasteurella multocida]|nr:hypothetical protein [Pasteurella multocida]HEH9658831.1 hypothetical protein [Pasteurella multocida]HEH9665621.1 hypothetical protein [Pasteurella multocida]HEH9665753.1 hypothetical protein [Pasteurella multocida]HEH9670200.1 hypothetical protein [Pasteurella multocida]